MLVRQPFLATAAVLVLFRVGITGSVGAQAALDDLGVTVRLAKLGKVDEPVLNQPDDGFLVDQPLEIEITGVDAEDMGKQFKLRVSSTDAKGVQWQSESAEMTFKSY